ncbi:hypothetical protein [Winogradskyella sp. SM1960]|uniref:hypothetical protein n=1 Tax=Winogradskyella sp. SM1960 TaxID=2865955 RepID=UPI001CD61895|nr:hypothetical protein [Winogradskyella sp. SM1960]
MKSSESTVVFYNNLKAHSKKPTVAGGVEIKYKRKRGVLVILGFEDLFISEFKDSCNLILNHSFRGLPYKNLLICRDVRNVMASRLNHPHMAPSLIKHKSQLEFTKKLWLDHHTVKDDNEIHVIRYGFLLKDLSGIIFEDYYLTDIRENEDISNRYGGGSSFETNNFSERYKAFEGNDCYEDLIQDMQMLDIKNHSTHWNN